MREVKTYWDLLAALQSLTPGQLQQPIQVAHPGPDGDKPIELMPGIAIGTVDEMGFFRCRSMVDNKYHAEEVVLLIDGNPFAEGGAVAYEMVGESFEDLDKHPLYGKDGPTDIKDQTAPERPSGIFNAGEETQMSQALASSLRWMTGVGNRMERET